MKVPIILVEPSSLVTPRLINTNIKEGLSTGFYKSRMNRLGGWGVHYQCLDTRISFWSLPIWRELHIFTEFKQSWPLIDNLGGGAGKYSSKISLLYQNENNVAGSKSLNTTGNILRRHWKNSFHVCTSLSLKFHRVFPNGIYSWLKSENFPRCVCVF